MPQILPARTAVRDLDAIWDYIAIDNAHPEAANELIDEFDASYRLLATNPLLGQSVEWLSANLRRAEELHHLLRTDRRWHSDRSSTACGKKHHGESL